MNNRIDNLSTHLRRFHENPEPLLVALRVPHDCHELGAVAFACEPALTNVCDYCDSETLLGARDVVRSIIRLLPENADLSRNDFASIDAVKTYLDPAYRALPLQQTLEPWWRETLREALLTRLLIDPDPTAIDSLSQALRQHIPISFVLRQQQKSPIVRMLLLADCLTAEETRPLRLAIVIKDTAGLLANLPPLRTETLHNENATALSALCTTKKTPVPPATPRERLSRLIRNIGVAAVAQRREYHTPAEPHLPFLETQFELVRRANKWNRAEQTALHAALLIGRLGTHLLQTNNQDPNCHIKCQQHNTWISRFLPDVPEFARQHEGPGFAGVSHQLNLPLPRRFGQMLASIASSGEGTLVLRNIEKRLRDLRRETAQPVSLRRITRIFEYELEHEPADDAFMMLLGLQSHAHRNAGIHYFSPDTKLVVQRVRSAIEQIATVLNLDVLDDGWSTAPPVPHQYFGYSFRADVGAIRALIDSLQEKAELGRGRSERQRIIDTYNTRVSLLTLMYLAGTGSRPTGTVLPSKSDVSFIDRAAIVSEKDALSYRSTRLVPLTTRFIAQATELERWAKTKQLLPRNQGEDTPLVMLRSGDGNYIAPTITALKQLVPGFAENWVWPDDMFRHLFRSRLSDLGCPSSWLRRTLGHHPPHGATDMPWNAKLQWDGLHEWTDVIDEHLRSLGF